MTINHDEIRQWAEARGGQPATVKGTGGEEDAGIIRIDFPGYAEKNLEPISWDEFFDKFDESNLALVYSETTRGQKSNFNKLISRESVDLETGDLVKEPRRRRKQGARKTAAKRSTATARRPAAKKAGAKKAAPRRATRKTAAAKGERRAPRSTAAKTARKTTGRSAQGAKKSTAKRSPSRSGSRSTRSRK